MKRVEAGGDALQCEERPVSRARRESPVDSVQTFEFAPSSAEHDCIVQEDGCDRRWAGAPLDNFVCTKCTFENPQSALTTMSPPIVCQMCGHTLQQAGIPSSNTNDQAFAEPTSAAGACLQMQHHRGVNKNRGSQLITQPQITAEDFLPTEDDALGVKCPTCTVLVAGVGKTRCPVCTTPLNGNKQGFLCGVCTLRNAPGAVVCSACETPLGGGEKAVRDRSDNVSVLLCDTEGTHSTVQQSKAECIQWFQELNTVKTERCPRTLS